MKVKAQGFESADSDDTLWIEQNHTDYDRRETGLYIHSTNQYSPQNIDDIPVMIAQLHAIYDDFEANKPLTFVEKMEAAAVGSVVTHRDGGAWMKHNDGMWVSYYGDRHAASVFRTDYEFVYEAQEAN